MDIAILSEITRLMGDIGSMQKDMSYRTHSINGYVQILWKANFAVMLPLLFLNI